jgi:hypothetical protein
MIGAVDIAAMLTRRILENDTYRPTGDIQVQEFVEHLFDIIQNFISTSSFEIDDESTLDHADSFDDSTEDDCEESEVDEETESDEKTEKSDKQVAQKFSLDYMKNALDYYDEVDDKGKRKHSWESVHHRFRRIPNREKLYLFRNYVACQGSKRQKIEEVDSFVSELFEDAREQSLCVHDADLRRWALQKARQQSMIEFSASDHWLANFKHRYNIVSRKITKIVSKHSIQNADEIEKSAKEFVDAVREDAKNYSSNEIFNTDQVGLEKEFHSSRTLTFKGERTTAGSVKSQSAATHSYTIQPLVSMAGQVIGPLFLCLQEPTGRISESEFETLPFLDV